MNYATPDLEYRKFIPEIPAVTTLTTATRFLIEGKYFSFSSRFSIPAGQSVYFMGVTNSHRVFFESFNVTSNTSAELRVDFFEAPTTTADGTAQTPINRNRPSSEVATMLLYSGPTVTADGTGLFTTSMFGTNQTANGNATMPQPFMLKTATKYVFKITNTHGSSVDVSANFFWYETQTL